MSLFVYIADMDKARPYISFLAAATTLASAGCASVPIVSRTAGPLGKQSVATELVIRPDVSFYAESWKNYRQDRGSSEALDASIERCRQKPDSCARLFQAWVKSIDFINEFPPERHLQKAALGLILVSSITTFDREKGTLLNALFHSGHWLQTPAKTLAQKNGAGVCGDHSVLVYETALRTGIPPSNISLIGGVQPGGGFHTVVAVTVDKQRYIMDPSVRVGSYAGDQNPLPSPVIAKYDDYLKGTTIEGNVHTSRFFPIVEMNEDGTRVVGDLFQVVAAPFRSEIKPETGNLLSDVMKDFPSQHPSAAMLKTAGELSRLMSAGDAPKATEPQNPPSRLSPLRR